MPEWLPERFVALQGIPSEEAFGGIESATPGPASVLMAGIPSAEAFGDMVCIGPPQGVQMQGIPSAEAFGGSVVHPGPATVGLFAKGSDEAFGNMTVTRGPVNVGLQGIPSAEAFGTLTIPSAVGYVSTSAGNKVFATSLTFDHTVNVGDYVIVQLETSQAASITSVTIGGVAMAQLGILLVSSGYIHALYGLKITAGMGSGSKSIVITPNTNTELVGRSVAYSNVVSVSAAVTVGPTTGSALSHPSLTCNSGERIVQGFAASNPLASGVSFSSPSGGTNRYMFPGSNRLGITLSDSPTNTSFAVTATPANYWNSIAVVLKPV
ncbi:minor tail protein [Mycobacterium phage Hawkeye]|uniref:Minor tail protein n=1 Tax=Mycobacterium phage Hawkeye TaxID=1458711 RepID=X2KSL9_9CAUD|nr:minor tail protein [Mycobacterium phage Hawkeye]AHN84046.1 hypothetical protein PBI_HAWKEYE_35 [Mycobacterium phage Hawkeye]